MALIFSELEKALPEIAARNVANKNRLKEARATVVAAVGDLAAMPTIFGEHITAINAAAAASPTDVAAQNMKATADKLVGDFVALQTEAAALQTAMGA